VTFDGTRALANSSRHATATAKTLAEREAVLNQLIEELFARIQQQDGRENDLFGDRYSPNNLPPELVDLKKRQAALRKAIAAAQAVDAKRQRRQDAPKKAAKVPVADPEAVLLPNKEGGHAPNYTPIMAVDGRHGLIAEADVLSTTPEAQAVIPMVERIEDHLGAVPAQVLADTAFATGQNLSDLRDRNIEAFMPVEAARLDQENPALRTDPTQPVAEADWPKLPRNPQSKKLDKAAFVYDASQDCYYCPMGRRMGQVRVTRDHKQCGDSVYQIYRCPDCSGCPLASVCLGKNARSRTVARDQHELVREELAARMRLPGGRKIYARRAWIAETPHAVIKEVMGLRRFLLRGLNKVRIEWQWACTAYNIRKLVKLIGVSRAQAVVCLE